MPKQDARDDSHTLPDFDALWNYDDPAATESAFRELLPAARDSGNAAYLAQLLTQIARTQGLQREFDAAHATLDEAEGLIPSAPTAARAADPTPRNASSLAVANIRLLLERGRVFNSSKKTDRARTLFLDAWDAARAAGEDFYAVDAAHMLGIVAAGDESLAWNEKAIALAERSADEKANGWLGSLYNNTGWTYQDMGRYANALGCHEKNLAWQREHGKPAMVRVAQWCIARTLRSLGRIDEALQRQRELLAVYEAEGGADGYVHEELGECLLLLGRAAEARPHFARAHELLSRDPWLVANEAARLERMRKLAGHGSE